MSVLLNNTNESYRVRSFLQNYLCMIGYCMIYPQNILLYYDTPSPSGPKAEATSGGAEAGGS